MHSPKTTRRELCGTVAAALTVSAVGVAAETPGPRLWLAQRGAGRVHLFPCGEAKDRSWFAPKVQTAFERSAELWLELGPPPSAQRINELYDTMGHQPAGRTLLDALDPAVRARAEQYMKELNISSASVETQRPWLAYYTFARQFDEKYKHQQGLTEPPASQMPPERVLALQAIQDHKPIHVEIKMQEWIGKLAGLSDELQSEYLQWLFDWFDDEKRGRHRDRFDWMEGHLVSRSIERMRTKYPDLYEVMDAQRNRWWVQKFDELLARGGEYFVAIGQDHCADSHGIPVLLVEMGVVKASQLKLV
jgi:uncharacterized protein YbaP (TraB family)